MQYQDLDILCEDGPVIAVNKPPGLISQGAPVGVPSLVGLVKEYLKAKYDKPGDVYLGIPHRIDRPVSGVVVFSRNSKCAARLAEQFAERQVKKTYLAVLQRPPTDNQGTLTDWLYRIPNEPRVIVCGPDQPDSRQAVLHYRVVARHQGRALVEIDLGTGRMHQIRIQFGSRGTPIVGDLQYGATVPFPGFRLEDPRDSPIALHAAQLTIQHPIRYEPLEIRAPVPRPWREFGFPAVNSGSEIRQ
ncbi:MAG: RNA pseudouridine synthase [Planctomycetota bacterium]|nr:MAG: RNA pseudouridine synthase [Planctomycetota bacterium]